jgi:hypothetical protein
MSEKATKAIRIMTVEDCEYGNMVYLYGDNSFRFDIDCVCKQCYETQLEVIQ